MRINLQGPYFLTQAAANWMIQTRKADDRFAACIVNISSILVMVALPSRGRVLHLEGRVSMATQLWAVRLGDVGHRRRHCSAIKTDMTAPVTEKYDKLIAQGLVQPRWGMPDGTPGRAVAMLVRATWRIPRLRPSWWTADLMMQVVEGARDWGLGISSRRRKPAGA